MIQDRVDFKGKWMPTMGMGAGWCQQKGVHIILTVSIKIGSNQHVFTM